jgi:hypothetical protein
LLQTEILEIEPFAFREIFGAGDDKVLLIKDPIFADAVYNYHKIWSERNRKLFVFLCSVAMV